MIIFGRGSSQLKTEHLSSVKCPHCQAEDSIDITVIGKYAHVFWIPTFAIGKEGVSQCRHCKQTLREKEMPADFKEAFKAFKATLKTPVWHFSGLLVIALFVGFIFISGKQNDQANAEFIQDPHQGDVYELKTDNGYYTLVKVFEVNGDSLEVVFNRYEIERASKVYTLNKEENFDGEHYVISRSDLVTLYDEGTILDVDR